MKQKTKKPIMINNESDAIVSLQIASVKVNRVACTPDICILFEDEDNATAAFFTPNQIDELVAKLKTLKG